MMTDGWRRQRAQIGDQQRDKLGRGQIGARVIRCFPVFMLLIHVHLFQWVTAHELKTLANNVERFLSKLIKHFFLFYQTL